MEHFESDLGIELADSIAKCVGHRKFSFVDPVFNHGDLTSLEYRLAKFKRFSLVEGHCLKQC